MPKFVLAQLKYLSRVFIAIPTYASEEFRFRAVDKIITICVFRCKVALTSETVEFSRTGLALMKLRSQFSTKLASH